MERKGHHKHSEHTVKKTDGKVETHIHHHSSHESGCHSHQESSSIQVTTQGHGAEGHHLSGHMHGAEGHHLRGHMHGAEGHHLTGHMHGAEGHHLTGHMHKFESHHVTTHTHGSESHHVTVHTHGSEGHHIHTHIHESVSHQEKVKAPEPIKVTPSIGGFFLFQTKEKVGIYQALQKKLVSEEVALALLEAQAATGHITDLSNNQKLSVEEAVQQGIVGPEYQEKLLLANSTATGYKHKEETMYLFQAFKKGLVSKSDAVRLLQAQIATGGIMNHATGGRVLISEALQLNYIDENLFKTLTGPSDFSRCYPDPNTKEDSSYQELLSKCFTDSETGLVLLTLHESLQGLRKSVNLEQLFKANIITQFQYDEVREGKQTIQKVGELQEVRQYLNGLSSIGAVYVESTKEKISVYQALKRNFLPADYAITLLQAQAASGFIVDPERKKTFTVTEAIQEGVVGFDLKEKLLNAERAVTGFNDLYTGKKISLFQAMKKELIERNLGLNLLQVQLATGGIIDPFHSFHVPLEVAYKRGLLDEDTAKLLSNPAYIIHGFLDPNTDDWVTYQELRSRSTFDADSNTAVFTLKLAFHGIRGKVTSDELLNSQIIDLTTYENLQQGKLSVQEVAEQEKVKSSLQGTGLIAGVADISTNGIKSIYQAMKEHLLMPGTSIALLEAQAATGYLIDPVKNLKFSVHDAVKNGLIGPELYEKLLSAEKAATGYKDPTSGEKLSLFQAIKRGFVTKDHGIHLLNAQLATGGIIDPLKKHRVPVEEAYTRGHFDDDTNKILQAQTDDIKGFFDPNVKENVTYEQLLQRSVIDVHSGLYLTPVFDNTQDAQKTAHSFIDYKTKVILDGIKLTFTFGKFKGLLVSLWQILFSEYFSIELRHSFIKLYRDGSLSVEELSSKVEAEIKQAVSSTKVVFEGLRGSVSPGQLLESGIIGKNLYDKLQQGEASAKDVVKIDTVKKYLQGTGSIGGLILADTQEKISIYQAKRKGFLRPGTSLILLEAQAATGYIIDPVKNKKYSVDEAFKANIIGPENYEKLLSAEKSVTGYKDPYTGERISLFQAMSKGLIVEEHGVRLLEAQIATGGIIDPINSHRIPVEAAYKRGYFNKKMNLILSDPSDDTKGFFDPNTNENLTYLQLKEKCITEPSTNLCLLPLVGKKQQFSINDHTRHSFRNMEVFVRYGRFRGQTLSVWVLINSEYFSEWRRRELLEQFRLKKLTLEQIIIVIQEEIKKWTEFRVPALRGQVNIYELLEYEIIEKELLEQVLEGKVTVEDVFKMEKVQKQLQGSGVLGGVIIQPSNQKVSFYEATKNKTLLPSTVLPLLEAQAATGHIVDPVNNQKLSVDEALKAAVVDPQIYERLASAEEALTGYRDPFSGEKISLFQAMKKGLVEEKHAKQLLEAQLATGGVIHPKHGFHLPDSAAKKHGYLSEELLVNLSHPTDDTKTFYDPTTKEKVTYSELLRRSQKDESTGLYLLPLPQDFTEVPVQNIYSDEEVRQLLKTARIEERNITVWDLIYSGYFTEEQQFEIVEKFKAKKWTLEELTVEILQIVRINEIKKTTHINIQGLRGNISVVWLLDLGIITQKTFDELVQGLKSVEEISQLAEVKKSLEGTGSISGVFLPSTKEKLSIYQALKKNLLLPANATMLLEAQAATGFIIDPVKNAKYSIDSAVKAGVVGPELHETLLTAESAVSGYTDPYTGNKISLGQAIQKKLITQKEGFPLLQAQLAAGGIIDPLHCHYVPLHLVHKLGFLDEEISKQTADLKIYVDPNTKEKVSYEQLKERCYTDPETGLLLLFLSESAAFYAEGHFIDAFKSFTVTLTTGRFKGQTVSLWEILNSEYISADKLKDFLFKYKTSSSEALQEIITTVTTIFEETEAANTHIKFKGIRRQVSASDLFQSKVINEKTLNELNLGKKTIDEVTEMDTVKRYLEGTNSIAGVLLQATNKKMGIYEAMLKGILRPGTALVLLEAQAATGFIIDPVKNEKLSVEEAFAKGLIGSDVQAKLLSAEQGVTGYTDPTSGERISLFQAMQKNLIVESHGIRLLEAQIATGGIIDPVHSHRVPVEVAYKRGYFSEEMNKILSDPSDDTKGFFDPNTHENLTYLQLVERCIQDPETGLYLLQVVKRGENYFYITDKMKADLQSRTIKFQFGRYADQSVSIWEILNSHYFTDLKRRELVRLYTLGVVSIDQLISNITTVTEEYESKSSNLKLKTIRGEVSATDLYNADIIDRKTLADLREGKISVEAVSELDSVKRYLRGTNCIAGVLSLSTNETFSIHEAINRGILSKDIGLILLQAQAATGHLIDPIKNQVLSISDAVSQGLVNADVQEQLEIGEKAVTGFTDSETGNRISLFQAIKKGIVPKVQGISLLDVQLATGGVVDPVYSHRLPLHVAYQRAYLDEDFYLLISDSRKKGFVDPNTHERITYKNLLERCVKDQKSGLYLLPWTERHDDYFYIDESTKKLLVETTVPMNTGKFKGQDISLWELLSSTYISEEKRKQLIQLYKTKTSSTLKDITSVIISTIEEKERGQNDIWFQGLKKQITAAELFGAGIINQETLDGLNKGLQTVNEVAKIDSIKQYLEGTSCIAGVLIPSKLDPTKKEKVNIYDAMLRRVLRPGTSLVLLEAQAATGFVIDSVQNRRLSVDEALSAGVIGYEIYDKLLSAEKGVTGYNDPYTGEKISLFQALQKDLIVKEHGIRLLEAQIATGGIIDPVHSHRVPLEVAYKRGYFDEEMNQILLDPTDDTKCFFDPNTHENLTYLQLLQRCVQDPDTGLYMLELKDSKFSQAQIQNKLQSSFIQITVGEFEGKSVSIWELINSKYFSTERREELLKKFESGTLTIEEILTITIKVLNETEQTLSQVSTTVSQVDTTDNADQEAKIQSWLQSEKVDVSVGKFKGQNISVWELLNSHYISGEKQKEILQRIQSETLTIKEIITILITIITETETEVVQESVPVLDEQPVEPENFVQDDEIEKALQSISIHVTKGQYARQEVSVWDLLNSKYIPTDIKQELLEDYKLTVQDIMQLVLQSLRETEQQSQFKTVYNLKVEVYNVLKTVQIEVTEGEFKAQKHSVWDLLNSKYFSEEKRRDLLEKFNSGTLSIDKLIQIIITIITETEERTNKLKFKGFRRQISVSELFTSRIINENTMRELTQGQKTVEEVTEMDTVKRYLEGTSCIAGVLVPSPKDPSKTDKMSIYDAMLKNILRPGTALVLLEAQAATGFIIDPVSNKKLSVDEAATAGLIGSELHRKLLSAEKAVTGYTDPYTGDKISLFQAMQKDLIVKDHGIRLLEAQIATGGIIDPVHSHRVPVEVAYNRGYFDEEMNQILSDPTDDTKGFFDPNTHENLTYLQLLSRCVQDPDTSFYMLTMKDKQALLTEKTSETSLQSLTITTEVGQQEGQTVSETITVEETISIVKSDTEDLEQGSSPTVEVFSLEEAVQDITEEKKESLYHEEIVDGVITIQEKDICYFPVRPKLYRQPDTDALRAFTVRVQAEEFQGKQVSLWDVLHSKYVSDDSRNTQLKKHQATVEKLKQRILSLIEDAETKADTEIQQKLESKLVEVNVGEFKGQNVSLWFLLYSKYITEEKRMELLEKYKLGTLTEEEFFTIIIKIIEETEQIQELKLEWEVKLTEINIGEFKGQNVSLWFLLYSKYITEEKRNELIVKYKSGTLTADEILRIVITIIEEKEKSRELKFKGFRRQVTASELFQSQIIDQPTLDELTQGSKTVEEVTQMDSVKRYLQGSSSIAGVFVTSKVDPSQRDKLTIYDAMFKGILRPGTALILLEAQAATGFVISPIQNQKLSVEEALAAGLIGQEIYEKLLSAERGVTGYNDPYTGGKISLFQAMKKDLIVKDHGIRLLEAQIATGGIIDPVHSHRVPVEVAYKRGYFDEEMNQILSDPSDDTKGFFDPNTNENLTYLQLLQRCVQDPETGLYMLDVSLTKVPSTQIEKENILKTKKIRVTHAQFQDRDVSLWELLNSEFISVAEREELLKKYNSGTLSVEELIPIVLKFFIQTVPVADTTPSADRETLLKSEKVEVSVGGFKGQQVSVWELLNSHYIVEEKRKEILEKYGNGTLTIPEIITILITIITELEVKMTEEELESSAIPLQQQVQPEPSLQEDEIQKALQSINILVRNGEYAGQEVSVWDLLHSKYISEEKRQELLGNYKLTLEDIIRLVVQSIEEGDQKSSQSQFNVEYTLKEKTFSTVQTIQIEETEGESEKRGELQTSSQTVHEMSLKEAVQGITEETKKSLLQSELVEITKGELQGQKLSLWDLLNSKHIEVSKKEEILQKYFSGVMPLEDIIRIITVIITGVEEKEATTQKTRILVTEGTVKIATDELQRALNAIVVNVKTSPSEEQKISLWDILHSNYLPEDKRNDQLSKHKLTVENLKQIITSLIDDLETEKDTEVQQKLEGKLTEVSVGEFKGQHVSLWFLLYSKYITEEKRMELLEKYKLGTLTEEECLTIIIRIIEETEQAQPIQVEKEIQEKLEAKLTEVNVGEFKGQNVSLWFLLYSKYITEEKRTELIEKYKLGTLPEEEFFTIIIRIIEETEQAQPIQVEKEIQEKLEAKLTEVNVGEFKGQNVSLWFLLYSKYITEVKRTELIEKYKLGTLTEEECLTIIIRIIEETEQAQPIQVEKEIQEKLEAKLTEVNVGEFKGQNVSLWFLLYSKYVTEEKRMELIEKYKLGTLTEEEFFRIIITIIQETEESLKINREKEIQQELELKLTEVTAGEFKGQNVSVWFLLYCKYITEEKRNELLEKYKSATLTADEILKIIFTIIEETEKRELKFKGFRRQVTATELLQSKIIDQPTVDELTQGKKTVEEITQMDSVKRYLEGSSSIAGVFVTSKTDPSQREKLTIYDAMLKQIIRPGSGLILLEAQAATGFIIDPVQNKKLSVEEALAAALIGHDIYDKLLSAERGVTGYNDPYTGEKISLFQAMKKDLIVKDHGIRLLEAQIATGGIIDPVHSHRVPVEVAYQRGYFDEEMNQILSDPSDDTKGFFDPKTNENLTYLQLLQRCVKDPETGLCMLDVSDGTSPSQEELKVKSVLQSKSVQILVGEFQGKDVSVWDLLYSRYILAEKQEEFLKQYRAGTLTIEELITILITIITETETAEKDKKLSPEIRAIKKSFLSVKIEISIGDFKEKSMSLWDLLHSKYIPEDKKEELIEKFKSKTLTIEEIISIVLSMIQKTESHSQTVIIQEQKIISVSDETEHWPSEDQLKQALQVIPSNLSIKPSEAGNVSMWDFLHSQSLPEDKRNMLLQTYKSSVREVMSVCTNIVKGTAAEDSTTQSLEISADQASAQTNKRVETQNLLQSVEVDVKVGQQESRKTSLWELLHNSHITGDRRNELLGGYESGTLGLQDLMKTIMQILMEAEKTSVQISSRQKVTLKSEQITLESIPEPVTKSLQVFTVSISSTEFTGENIALWDLLQSKNITKAKRLDLLKTYFLTIKAISAMLTGSSSKTVTVVTQKPDTATFLKSVRVQVDIGEFKLEGQSHSLWELLHSQYITEEKRKELIQQYESGAITWEQMFNLITTIIKETEEKTRHIKFKE